MVNINTLTKRDLKTAKAILTALKFLGISQDDLEKLKVYDVLLDSVNKLNKELIQLKIDLDNVKKENQDLKRKYEDFTNMTAKKEKSISPMEVIKEYSQSIEDFNPYGKPTR